MASSEWINLETFSEHPLVRYLLPVLASALILSSLIFVFRVVPDEQVMGPVQRIFYFHVGSAITSYVLITVLLVSSCLSLVTTRSAWDALAQASAGVAFLFCSLVLLTGMIWGHSAWNTWWRWEPRLVSSLLLWMILAGYLVVRAFSAGHVRQQNFLSVLGIVAACFVPIVIFSIQLLDQTEQLHPQVVSRGGLSDPLYRRCLAWSTVSLIALGAWLLASSLRNRLLEGELLRLERELARARHETEHAHA